jgi:hypothetical protein
MLTLTLIAISLALLTSGYFIGWMIVDLFHLFADVFALPENYSHAIAFLCVYFTIIFGILVGKEFYRYYRIDPKYREKDLELSYIFTWMILGAFIFADINLYPLFF